MIKAHGSQSSLEPDGSGVADNTQMVAKWFPGAVETGQRHASSRHCPRDASSTECRLPARKSPQTIEDVLKRFTDPVDRLTMLLRQKWPGLKQIHGGCGAQDWQEVWFTTSYSGIGFPEAAISILVKELAAVGLELKVRFVSACEIDEVPRRALLQHKHCPDHVFGDITSRIPCDLRDKLLRSAKVRRDAIAERVAVVKAALGSIEARKVKTAMVAELGQEFVHEASGALDGVPVASQLWCYRHAQFCPVQDVPSCLQEGGLSPCQPLRVEIAGSTCVAWSSMGSHWGWLDDSSIPCLVWMHTTAAARPDMILHECTTSFQAEQFRPTFRSDVYSLQSLVTCPTDWGIPVERARRYTLMVLHTRRRYFQQNQAATSYSLSSMGRSQGKRRKLLAHTVPEPALTADSLDFTSEVMAAIFFAELRTDCGIFLRATRSQMKDFYIKTKFRQAAATAAVLQAEVGLRLASWILFAKALKSTCRLATCCMSNASWAGRWFLCRSRPSTSNTTSCLHAPQCWCATACCTAWRKSVWCCQENHCRCKGCQCQPCWPVFPI